MERLRVDDACLEYEVIGAGPPVLLIHGANLADGLLPIARHPTLAGRFRMIRYHRRRMAGSTGAGGPISVERQAGDAVELLSAIGVEQAHVLGYSYGATVALEVAAAAPASVLEPILTQVPAADGFMRQMAPLMERYRAGDVEGAVAASFEGLGGPNWRSLVEAAVPGGVEQAVADAAVFFDAEAASLAEWRLDERRAAAVSCPVLSVRGRDSGPFFAEGRELLHRWFPRCADADIDGAGHLLHIQQPDAVVAAIATFLASISPDA
jgi:pimeloyl-ACP methyl ester carboxylesterase